MSPCSDTVPVHVDRLRAWGAALFAALGCDAAEARRVADGWSMPTATATIRTASAWRRNTSSRCAMGWSHPAAAARGQRYRGAGCAGRADGFGRTVGEAAIDLAIRRAREHGCAVVGLAHTHHLGRIGQWGERCADAGLVSNPLRQRALAAWVAPHGGSDARVSTNPFCVAVPHAPHPLVLDYATSAVALGKTRVAVDEGRELAPGLLARCAGTADDRPGRAVAR